ncbi:MAG: DUF4870 family protein [Candidatus Eiseniibacteriota bacterium]
MASTEVTPAGQGRNHADMAKLVYILCAVGLFVPVTWIVGVVIAYVYRGDAPVDLKTHFTFQVRTFWLGVLGMFVSALTVFVVIGWFLGLAVLVWTIVRLVKGWKWLDEVRPVPNPTSLMFGE